MTMKVAFARCADYQSAAIEAALTRALACLDAPQLRGGKPLRVLIKPNLLTDRPPAAAATTHPEVVRAIIRILRRHGHQPVVADSAASPHKMERVWAVTGFAGMCAEENVPLLNLEQAGARMFEYQGVPFSIARPVLEADLVVNAPKLKTHLLTIMTGAVKNIYGVIPGAQKTALHRAFPSAALLGGFLAHLYSLVRPGLTVCDAVLAMDGNGPAAGRPVRLGFLAAADDGVALELAICRLLRIRPADLPYLTTPLVARNSMDAPESFSIMGDFTAATRLPAFELPVTFVRRLIPARLVRKLRRWLWSRPVFGPNCIRCGRCVAACPAPAIALPDAGPPRLEWSACIECGCCSEVCPVNAIAIRQSRLLRAVQFARMATGKILAAKNEPAP